MLKYKLTTLILLGLISCNTPNKDSSYKEKEEIYIIDKHDHVLSRTDSILVLADKEFKIIKQKQVEQNIFVDSLRYEIHTEQNIINNINRELDKRMDIEQDLQLTRQELKKSLTECKNKEKELKELNEKFSLKSEQFMDEIEYYIDREVKLVTIYNHKIDSLYFVIDSLPRVRRFRNKYNKNEKNNN